MAISSQNACKGMTLPKLVKESRKLLREHKAAMKELRDMIE